MATMTARDVLAFHAVDREVFDKVVAAGRTNRVARNVVALWMWLDTMGIDAISPMRSCTDNNTIIRFIREAEAILDCLRQDAHPPADRTNSLPLMASLVAEPLTLRFFYCHSNVAARGISAILDGVGTVIFDDGLWAAFRTYDAQVRRGERPQLPPQLAKPYRPNVIESSEDSRSMFITFSKGCPLSREDIIDYFNGKWGECVVKVMMERTTSGVLPMYGRVVLTSESLIDLVLGGEQLVKFVVNGRQLWARKYVPRRNINNSSATA